MPFIVFAANAFAMLGLRALYFALAGLMDRFVYLTYGLAVMLGFVGVKMLLADLWKMPAWLSLAVIVGVLAVTALLSMRASAGAPSRRRHRSRSGARAASAAPYRSAPSALRATRSGTGSSLRSPGARIRRVGLSGEVRSM